MKFEEYSRLIEYLCHLVFVFLFFVVITAFVYLAFLYLKYLTTLSKKQTGKEHLRYVDFVKSKFTKLNEYIVLVLVPLCLAGTTLSVSSIRAYYCAKSAYYRANKPIFELLNTSMLRIRTGNLGYRVPEREKELYKTRVKDEIKEFLDKISIDPSNPDNGSICPCYGHMTFEFYDANDKLINACNFFNNGRLRFPNLMGDLCLTPQSIDLVIGWLDEKIGRNEDQAIKAWWDIIKHVP